MARGFGWFLENAPPRPHLRALGGPRLNPRRRVADAVFRQRQPRCPALSLGPGAAVAALQRRAEPRGGGPGAGARPASPPTLAPTV